MLWFLLINFPLYKCHWFSTNAALFSHGQIWAPGNKKKKVSQKRGKILREQFHFFFQKKKTYLISKRDWHKKPGIIRSKKERLSSKKTQQRASGLWTPNENNTKNEPMQGRSGLSQYHIMRSPLTWWIIGEYRVILLLMQSKHNGGSRFYRFIWITVTSGCELCSPFVLDLSVLHFTSKRYLILATLEMHSSDKSSYDHLQLTCNRAFNPFA